MEEQLMAAMIQVIKQVAGEQSGQEISDEEATQALQGIYQKAQNGDQTSMKQFQEIQQAAQQLLQNQQAQKALHGAKLQYIRRLSGKCNEDEQMAYFKCGGKVYSKQVKKVKKGAKGCKQVACSKCGGGISKVMNGIKAQLHQKGGNTQQINKTQSTNIIIEKGKNNGTKPEPKIPLADKKKYDAILAKPRKQWSSQDLAFLQHINRSYPNQTGSN